MGTGTTALHRIAFIGGYLPRRCGIATFTTDLCEAVAAAAPSADCFTGAVNDHPEGYAYPPRVRFELFQHDLDSYHRAAEFLNRSGVEALCIQHEFGIYGGPAGDHLLTLLREVRMPVVTTLHTLLKNPDPAQRTTMEGLIRYSDRLVVMARKGAEILQETYQAPPSKVQIILHGIPDMPFRDSSFYKGLFGVEGRQVLFTFGLLGPGKGIEYAIEAMPEIVRRHPKVAYLILGASHPHLVAREGEAYRLALQKLARECGVEDHVIFYDRFVSVDELKAFIGATDIYVTPYLAEAQITSGTLAYVFGAGKAVVSTPYWHAQELLAQDRGILVPFRDASAIAEGVCTYLDDPIRMNNTRRVAYAMGREMRWPAVGKLYLELLQRVAMERRPVLEAAFAPLPPASQPSQWPAPRLDHLERLSDATGVLQHATFNVPNYLEGYCTDDNARAYILCTLLDRGADSPMTFANLGRLTTSYLAFLHSALNHETGCFRNFMSHGRVWLEEAGSEDSHGRALWALGTGVCMTRNKGHQKLATHLFDRGLPVVDSFHSPRAWAFTLLGIHAFLRRHPGREEVQRMREELLHRLMGLWHHHASEDWPWFEPVATYDNARLCQVLIQAGQTTPEAKEIGLKALEWLVAMQRAPTGHFRPIGSNGFFAKDGIQAAFDQQPVEAQAMISACLEAFRSTHDKAWYREAKRAFEWFLGWNDLGLPLVEPETGACWDGLHVDRINENQGAESTLAFQLSLAEMNGAEVMLASGMNGYQLPGTTHATHGR